MQKKLLLAVIAFCSLQAFGQTNETEEQKASLTTESAFTFTEAQLGEDMPTVGNRPVNGQNTYFCWEVLWFFYNAVLPLKK